MFSTSTWRITSEEKRHAVHSTENDHEVYQLTTIFADATNSSLPFVLVKADPIKAVNALPWYFLRGSYSKVVQFTDELPFHGWF